MLTHTPQLLGLPMAFEQRKGRASPMLDATRRCCLRLYGFCLIIRAGHVSARVLECRSFGCGPLRVNCAVVAIITCYACCARLRHALDVQDLASCWAFVQRSCISVFVIAVVKAIVGAKLSSMWLFCGHARCSNGCMFCSRWICSGAHLATPAKSQVCAL